MKIRVLLVGTVLCIPTLQANAESCMTGPACEATDPDVIISPITNCYPGTYYEATSCIEGIESGNLYYVYNCRCPSGYTEKTTNVGTCDDLTHVISCSCQCNNCSNGAWESYSTGYQRKTNRSCDCSSGTPTCKISNYSYQCAAGYYGSSINGTSGCTQCPEWSTVYTTSARTTKVRGTSVAGATEITGCYVPAGTYYDVTGTIKIIGQCPYKQ